MADFFPYRILVDALVFHDDEPSLVDMFYRDFMAWFIGFNHRFIF
jgi:hypothetical protein